MSQESAMGWADTLGSNLAYPPQPSPGGETIVALGRDWPVSAAVKRVKGLFEMWCRRQALYAVEEAAVIAGAETASLYRAAYLAERASGAYNWTSYKRMGRAIRKALNDLPGSHFLLYLLLKECDRSMTEDQASEIYMDNQVGADAAMTWAVGNGEAPDSSGANQKTTAPKTPTPPSQEMSTLDGN